MRRATFAMIIAAVWLLMGARPATGASKPETYTLTCSKSRVYPDRDRARRAMEGVTKMIKIDIAEVERAASGA